MDPDLPLDEFIAEAKYILAKFETRMGWDPPDLDNVVKMAVCPYDKGHRMPKDRFESHEKICKWRKLGYSREDAKEIVEAEENCRKSTSTSTVNYVQIIAQIAPNAGPIRTEQHYKVALTPQQRLEVYNAEVAQCYSSQKPDPDKALYADLEATAAEKVYQKENPENLSKHALLQKLRDMKRRRQSYRAKNVHITKRSQTEIIRGVLEVHMDELTKLWNPDRQTDTGEATERTNDALTDARESAGSSSRLGENKRDHRGSYHDGMNFNHKPYSRSEDSRTREPLPNESRRGREPYNDKDDQKSRKLYSNKRYEHRTGTHDRLHYDDTTRDYYKTSYHNNRSEREAYYKKHRSREPYNNSESGFSHSREDDTPSTSAAKPPIDSDSDYGERKWDRKKRKREKSEKRRKKKKSKE